MDTESARQLLDLDLEGIREAPIGLVVCCDRRAPAGGVLGRATFPDADMWSCACAIQNLWLAARAEGLGVGWVTLFEPDELAQLVAVPGGVDTLGWLCVGWPDERPPGPGLERRGWSRRLPLADVVFEERWPGKGPTPPPSRLAAPDPAAVVAAHDSGDALLTPPGSLGVLDRAVDRVLAAGRGRPGAKRAVLVLAAADHPVAALGVSAYESGVTRTIVEAAVAGTAIGVVAARGSGMDVVIVDAGVDGPPVPGARSSRPSGPRGDLVTADALSPADVDMLVAAGSYLASELVGQGAGLIALGEVGVANTTVAAALAAALLGRDPQQLVGLGSGSDSAMLAVKRRVVGLAVSRLDPMAVGEPGGWKRMLAGLGGGEIAFLAGVTLGAAEGGATVVLDGMATGVAALLAVEAEPAVASHLIAGQRSRETGHAMILERLGVEPLLDLRLRAGEGVGAVMATGLLRAALHLRASAARTTSGPIGSPDDHAR
jgi:nicotinate-nucleotide--dimethylbenzimidazole phosphoribosyltransferase